MPGTMLPKLGEQTVMQHAMLPLWEAWLQGVAVEDGAMLQWPREVHILAPSLLITPRVPESEGLVSLVRGWRERDFAWHDPTCGNSGSGPRNKAAADVCLRHCI